MPRGFLRRRMTLKTLLPAAAALLCVLLLPSPGLALSDTVPYSDGTCGFRISYPSGWATAHGKDNAFVINSPDQPDTQVAIDGIWDSAALGSYMGPSALMRAVGTVVEVLLDTERGVRSCH